MTITDPPDEYWHIYSMWKWIPININIKSDRKHDTYVFDLLAHYLPVEFGHDPIFLGMVNNNISSIIIEDIIIS